MIRDSEYANGTGLVRYPKGHRHKIVCQGWLLLLQHLHIKRSVSTLRKIENYHAQDWCRARKSFELTML
jgi:hypothetical protein